MTLGKEKDMTRRKFYRHRIVLEILTENKDERIDDMSSVYFAVQACYDGGLSGRVVGTRRTVLDGKKAAQALIRQGSDPEFFSINEDGTDVGEEAET